MRPKNILRPKITRSLGYEARTAFLVRNPHLESILDNHARGWRLEKESALNQLAVETGGRFLHSTNDIAAAAEQALRTTGRLYYLGFMSPNPPNGRYHRIRVTTRLTEARLYGREGYVAGGSSKAPTPAPGREASNQELLLARAREAQANGSTAELAECLEVLLQQQPEESSHWYNLGLAYLRLGKTEQAVAALRKSYLIAPDDAPIGVTLARALAISGQYEAAEETLRPLSRSQPQDINLLLDLGRICEARGQDREAYRIYRSILDRTAKPGLEAYLPLIRTARRLDRATEAQIFVEEYLARGGEPSRIVEIVPPVQSKSR